MKNAIIKASSSSNSSPKKAASPKKLVNKTKAIKKAKAPTVKSIGKPKAKSATTSPTKKIAKNSNKEEVKQQPKDMWDYFTLDRKYKKLYVVPLLNSLIAALRHVQSTVEMSPTASSEVSPLQLICPLHSPSRTQASLSALTMPAAVTPLV